MTDRLNKMFLDPPLWRIEWRDAEGYIAQVSILNEESYEDLKMKDIAAIIKEVGGATSVKIQKLDDYLRPIEDDDS